MRDKHKKKRLSYKSAVTGVATTGLLVSIWYWLRHDSTRIG